MYKSIEIQPYRKTKTYKHIHMQTARETDIKKKYHRELPGWKVTFCNLLGEGGGWGVGDLHPPVLFSQPELSRLYHFFLPLPPLLLTNLWTQFLWKKQEMFILNHWKWMFEFFFAKTVFKHFSEAIEAIEGRSKIDVNTLEGGGGVSSAVMLLYRTAPPLSPVR